MTADYRQRLEKFAEEETKRMLDTVPRAAEFHRGEWITKDYYLRHLVETILRIRLNNEVDAYGLYKIGDKDNKLSAILAQYLAEEYGHEGMFMRDVQKFGLTLQDVNGITPTFATDKLIGYMYLSIDKDGPLPTMIWNWFVEWYSDRYNKVITENAARQFGKEYVKGSFGHIHFDESHDHDDLMWGAVSRAIDGWGSYEVAQQYLKNFISLVGDYFQELYDTTVPQHH